MANAGCKKMGITLEFWSSVDYGGGNVGMYLPVGGLCRKGRQLESLGIPCSTSPVGDPTVDSGLGWSVSGCDFSWLDWDGVSVAVISIGASLALVFCSWLLLHVSHRGSGGIATPVIV